MTWWRRIVAFVGVVAFVTVAASGQSSALASPWIYAYDAAVQHLPTTTHEHGAFGTAIRASVRAEEPISGNPVRPFSDAVAAAGATGAARIPFGPGTEKAWNVLERVNAKGSPLPGYKVSVFKNDEGRLPGADGAGNPISYLEWDVNPYTEGVDRGPERVVTGSDGSAYWTGDHYDSFLRFWGPGR